MKIGFVGLGKLGYPCAVAASLKGHDVMGYDVNPMAMNNEPKTYNETTEDGVTHINSILTRSRVRFGTLAEVVQHSDILFVAVQTPHEPSYEGITRLPEDRVDFNYTFLVDAIKSISAVAKTPKIVSIISTVLPGTVRKYVLPAASGKLKICYNPFFIAMGTTMRDYLHPEFILLGVHDGQAAQAVERYYASICNAPVYRTTVENAELIKVGYNTFIGMKIVFANTLMEICHKLPGTDIDQVMGGIKMSNRRLISTAYLNGGMGDGGGCHPRDNIALSWLARKLDLSFDWFESVMIGRERQTEWLADLMCEYDLPKALIGYAFKPETRLCVGSPALLLEAMLKERGHDVFRYDPVVEGKERDLTVLEPMVCLLGANHRILKNVKLPPGSVLIDPWRFVENCGPDVKIVHVGRGPEIDSAVETLARTA